MSDQLSGGSDRSDRSDGRSARIRESCKYLYRFLSHLLITAMVTGLFSYYWITEVNRYLNKPFFYRGYFVIIGMYAFLAALFFVVLGGYKIGVGRISHTIMAQVLAMFLTNFITLIFAAMMVMKVRRIRKIVPVFGQIFLYDAVLLFVATVFFVKLYRHIFPPYRILQIYGDRENDLVRKMNRRDDKYEIHAEVRYDTDFGQILRMMDDYDALLINDVPEDVRNRLLNICFEKKKRVYFKTSMCAGSKK